jgi:hypothetical protein
MELIIHGTKGGYRLFDNSKTSYTTTGDIRDYLSNSIGESLYTLNFKKEGVSISKITIIEDLGRGAFGFLAITLFLARNEKLDGKSIHELLDKATKHYLETYTNRQELAEDTREDWAQFNQIKNEYSSISSYDERFFEPTSNSKKYLFYNNEDELESVFDYPFYPAFDGPRIIFLVDCIYKDNHNCPLNLSHSDFIKGGDLTTIVELDNPEYRLQQVPSSIQVYSNGIPIYSGGAIRKQDALTIIWKKQFFKVLNSGETSIAERLKNQNDSLGCYIEITNRNITIKPRHDFEPVVKIIKINANKSNVDFSLQYNDDIKNNINNEFHFIGDDIGKIWNIKINTPNFKANTASIQPSIINTDSIDISFTEYRSYSDFDVRVMDELNSPISHFRITINGKDYYKGDTIHLKEEDLKNKCRYYVSASGYNAKDGNFDPKTTFDFPSITLVKATNVIGDTKGYKPESGVGGAILTGKGAEWAKTNQPGGRGSGQKNGSDLDILKPNKKTLIVLVGITLFMAIGVLVFKSYQNNKDKAKETSTHLTSQNILEYCIGDTLKLNELKKYQQKYCESDNESSNKGGVLDWLFMRETDDTPEEDCNCDTLEIAIKFREALNNGEIDYLVDTLKTFGHIDLSTKIAEIQNIDSIKDKVSQSMKVSKVSEMTISEIVTQLTTLESILTFNEAKADGTTVDGKIFQTKQLELIDSTLRLDILKKLDSRKQVLTKGSISNNNSESPPVSKDTDRAKSDNNQTKEAQAQKAQPQKAQPQKAQPQKAQPQKAQPQKAQPQKAQAQKAQPQKAQAQKAPTKKAPTKKAPTNNKNTTAVGEQRK